MSYQRSIDPEAATLNPEDGWPTDEGAESATHSGNGAADEYFPSSEEAEAQRRAEELPAVRPWLDVQGSPAEILIGPGRWLTVGSGILVVAATGVGKSTWSATQAFAWSLGRPSLGFVPTRPLKSLLFQAEDDDGDLEAMRAGAVASLSLSDVDIETLRANVLLVTERAKTGLEFLGRVVAPLAERIRPDLPWINPLAAYFGDDLNDQRSVARFFRNTLNPILARIGCGLLAIHHTPKPSRDRRDWSGPELAYAGSGSADLSNWARDVLTIREIRPGLFEMAAAKRWRHLDF
jgi:hypothetical protein